MHVHMTRITEAAEKLNNTLEQKAPAIYSLLSRNGQKAFFPHAGILGQTAESKGTKINATIGQAFEEDGRPMVLDTFLSQVKLPQETFLYSPSYGQKKLRELWQREIKRKNPSLKTNITLPIATSGITHGLYLAGELFIGEDETVIIPDKLWGNYKVIYKHANFDEFECFKGKGFNVHGLEEKLSGSNQKKIVLLNFPNNPTGYTPTEQEAEEITNAVKDSAERNNSIAVICDDAYFGLVFEDGTYKESIFAKLAGLHERVLAVKIDGITKETYAWGLRVGFVTYGFKGMDEEASSALEDKTAGTVRGTVSNVCTHSQFLAINALQSQEFIPQTEEKYKTLKQRYDTIKKTLEDNQRYSEFFEALPFNSGYFMCIKLKQNNTEQARRGLIKNHSTGIIATGGTLRIAYSAISKDDIPKLFENVYNECKR